MNARDREFDAVIRAAASYSRRPSLSPEERRRIEAENHKNDPKHKAALARRKKRKRGGPK
jgi:hypothetical protein